MKLKEINRFHVFGIHHQNADISIRESFSMSENQMNAFLEESNCQEDESMLVLSTCNRTEVWCTFTEITRIKESFVKHTKGNIQTFEALHFDKSGINAIEHIFGVAAGIDSQILGDLQIQSQIKKAIRLSQEKHCNSAEMDRLIQMSLRYSKRIKNETGISEGAASVAYAAVQYILENSSDLKNRRILLYGTGKIGSITCENLKKHIYAKNLVLTNRTKENAEALAKRIGAQVKPIESLKEELDMCDVLIVATGAEKFTIDHEIFSGLTSKKRLLIDLSVPRNIDSSLEDLEDVSIADVDLLSKMQEKAITNRQKAIPKAKAILEEAKLEFLNWMNIRHLSPTFEAIKNKLHELRLEEMDYHKNKITDLDLEKLDGITSSLMNKIARQMINHLKENHDSESDPVKTLSSILELNK